MPQWAGGISAKKRILPLLDLDCSGVGLRCVHERSPPFTLQALYSLTVYLENS
jgi:hypothetical protein